MPYAAECILGTLAAVGFICILKGIYDIIMMSYARAAESATLYLRGDGTAPSSERLLLAAEQAQRIYLPRMRIVFVEENTEDAGENLAARLAARRGIIYIKPSGTSKDRDGNARK